ncbi:MAG: hypothetical protein LBK92_00950 [Endomicrobium sp.]|jgi:hypothetical protein|nr:hypothetical protein [Endomicrobium sp.]
MLKLVSVVLMFFVTVQCWAAPWDGSITANNVWNPEGRTINDEIQEQAILAGTVARMEAEADVRIMRLPQRRQIAVIRNRVNAAEAQIMAQNFQTIRTKPQNKD